MDAPAGTLSGADPASAAPAGIGGSGGIGGDSVLSQKVARALQVRSDTPAMLAALDALADLPSYGGGNNNKSVGDMTTKGGAAGAAGMAGGTGGSIDPRTVRQAIEIDALHQAQLLRSELSAVVDTVTNLRDKITAVSDAAKMVGAEMRRDVVAGSLDGDHHHSHGHHSHHRRHEESKSAASEREGDVEKGGEEDPIVRALRGDADAAEELNLPPDLTISPSALSSYSTSGSGSDPLTAERRLAGLLHSAFVQRHSAAVRAETVQKFLDRFDLSPQHEALLERYGFEEFGGPDGAGGGMSGGGMGGVGGGGGTEEGGDGDGMAFLDALEHVRKIRSELVRTFDLDSSANSANSSSADGATISTADAAMSSTSTSQSQMGLTSALRMMESLSNRQERAYERLYHFLTNYLDLHSRSVSNVPTRSGTQQQSQQSLANSNLEDDALDSALRHPFVVRSLTVLRHKPSYHAHTLELIAASRRALVTRKFLLALTSGYDGSPPIEMGAHDPVQYVGDMLAFVFRVESEEADLVRGLADCSEGGDGDEGDAATSGEDDGDGTTDTDNNENNMMDKPMSSTAVLSHATSGISRPLKSRVFQVIASLARHPDESAAASGEDGDAADSGGIGGHGPDGTFTAHDLDEEAGSARTHLSQLYEICGLLLYYRSAFHKTVSRLVKGSGTGASPSEDDQDDDALSRCIQECLDEAAVGFGASLRVYAATLPNIASLSNESESALVQGTVARICEVRMGSPGFFSATTEDQDHDHDAKLKSLSVEFLVDSTVGAALSHCDRLDDAVALRNPVVTAKKAGLESSVATKWDKALSEQERTLADSLIDGETRHVLESIGLAPVADALKDMGAVYVEGQLIASHPGLAPADVRSALKDFYDSLYSPPMPPFDQIRDPVLRKYARGKTAENVVEAYAKIYDALRSDRGGYDDLSFLSMSPEQVQTLLSV